MKNNLMLCLAVSSSLAAMGQQKRPTVIYSPDKNISAEVTFQSTIMLKVKYQGEELVNNIHVALDVAEAPEAFKNPKVKSISRTSHQAKIIPTLPEKRSVIPDVYNQAEIWCKGDYGIKIRVYNDGAAWRLLTKFQKTITVKNEALAFEMDAKDSVYVGHEETLISSFQELYPYNSCKEMKPDFLCTLPILYRKASGKLVAFTESDVRDYPGLNLNTSSTISLGYEACLAKAVKETKISEDLRSLIPSERFDYIAVTEGTREFPWRVFGIASQDAQLLENDIVFRLASPCELKETAWIVPGKAAWEWCSDWNLTGVPFKAGINTETYKYFIDFAAKYGLEYMVIDEGWYAKEDIEKLNPALHMEELATYAKQKKVGLILWVSHKAFAEKMESVLDRLAAWGCSGIKLDFVKRDDQQVINFIEAVTKECAKRRLLLDLHGVSKPAGFNRTYPNQLTREGVKGNENNKWSKDITPAFTTTLPFTRMFAGSIDFTPGGMRNVSVKDFSPNRSAPQVMGTRCAELAKFVIYDCPLPTLSDSPSLYEKEPEAMDFISHIPVVWDATIGISARAAKYIIEARLYKDTWYIGAMTNEAMAKDVPLSFLPEGNFTLEIWEDGMNAEKNATDFNYRKLAVNKNTTIKIKMVHGGGFAGRIKKN
ncbi:MAG: hypothetical protein CRN43_17345 [Candidatus Nephrothrix sp. EaCA]|nr:MAG: hypothetical protein CRN43_17345 [Candidatus Nephrothrix sp. EaCA]